LEVIFVKSPGSFEWLRDQVSAAVQQRAKENNPLGKDGVNDVYVSETYADFVIVRDYGQNKWWKVPYAIDDKNVVTLGDATEVAQTWTEITKSIRMLVPVQKADMPKHMRQISYGVVFEPTSDEIKKGDLQGDCMKAEDIELAAHRFMENYQTVGEMHKSVVAKAKVVESYCAPCDFTVETSGGSETVLKGSWVLAVKWPDAEWAQIEKGEHTGYSAGGFGFRTPVTDAAGAQQTTVSKADDGSTATTGLNWLWGMDIQEVSKVTRGANGKKFFILKTAEPEDTHEPESIRKTDRPSLSGWVRDALRKVAGGSGPDDGGSEMTPDEIKKAVTDSLVEGLKPFDERITKLERDMAEAPAAGEEGTTVQKEAPAAGEAAEPAADQVLKTAIAEGITEGLKPIEDRIAKLETAAGQRQSGLEEGGAHPVAKSADGGFSWQGSGLLI
jgi:hypothetical protein